MYRVLVVEKERKIRYIYRNMKEWENNGFIIAAEAENGRKALELLKTENFDLIFLDPVLPEMDGFQLLEEMEKRDCRIPAVIASAYHEFEYARRGMQCGAVDYLIKPVSEEHLDQCLRKLRCRLDKNPGNNSVDRMIRECGIDAGKPTIQKMKRYLVEKNDIPQGVPDDIPCDVLIDVSMEDVANFCGLSKDYFGKLFRQESGCSFQQFIMRYKMECAKALLIDTDLRIYEISAKLGYKTTDYFTQLFRKYTGFSPQQYRKSYK